MESEVSEFAAALGAPTGEKSGSVACEDVLLPSDSVSTNGISNMSATGEINFLEERVEDLIDDNEMHDKDEFIVEVPEEEDEEEEEIDGEVAEEDEEDEEEELDAETETENAAQQKECAQLPKKRKFAPSADAHSAIAADEEGEEDDDGELEDDEENVHDDEVDEIEQHMKIEAVLPDAPLPVMQEDEELPTSSARAAANKENTVDEEICRVCTTKDSLVSLFKRIDQQTVADMLMVICPTVSIARKDFMPQYICQPCLDNASIAIQLKTQCESTERELRKKLSRHKNKVRRPSGYVVIDAPVESDPEEEEEEPADDVEFKVSDVEVSASADESDTDDSDFSSKKKRVGRGGKRGRRKSSVSNTGAKRMGRPPKRAMLSSDEEGIIEKKKKESYSADGQQIEFACDECDQVFARKLSLVLHKKAHAQNPPITCKLCGKNFKIKGAYRTHLERHKSDTTQYNCSKCDLFFTTKAELKKHQMEEHEDIKEGALFCQHCKRSFVSEQRLKRHLEHYCPNNQTVQKHRRSDVETYPTGKDLFKTVAPLTTTYWSDSFSD